MGLMPSSLSLGANIVPIFAYYYLPKGDWSIFILSPVMQHEWRGWMRKHLLLIQKYVLEQSFVQIPFSKVLEIRGFYELGKCVIIMQWNSQIPFWKVSVSITIKTANFNHECQCTSQSIIFTLPNPPLYHHKNWYTVVHWSIKTFPFAKANTAWNCILGIQMSKSFLFHFENSLKDRFRQKFGKKGLCNCLRGRV